ncbi:hypothetical protein JKA74_03170 [Marivirga sp. S37H4]|uniref:Uncharacterized protein n=1 Tax=Marivirga aurantiaca TaxID=2802615 RepID=A0A935C5S3_9BACT|nr:hypothetical protein [Marivirga aurantiaca]MBK6264026.1 hypothetical protein [Marivirga aurantiaca]
MRLYTHPKLRITIEEIRGMPYIKEVWRGIFNPIVFRDLIGNSLEIYKTELPKIKMEDQTKFLLFADTKELELIRNEDITWLNEEINPKYEQLGFTHQAVIAPISQFASNKVDDYHTDDDNLPFVTKIFKEDSLAMKWFLNC